MDPKLARNASDFAPDSSDFAPDLPESGVSGATSKQKIQ
jgi:hypothetical protein